MKNWNTTLAILLFGLFASCQHQDKQVKSVPEEPKFQNMGHELVYKMAQKTGDYNSLLALKDVTYTYTYRTADKKEDISTEKYIFDGELSLGTYSKHERTLPDLEGNMIQSYDGASFYLTNDGKSIKDEAMLKGVAFTRKTNFYWFAMMQKLLDPGIKYEYLGTASISDKNYDIVKVSFDSPADQPKDIYQLYINKKTTLVDQFLFTVVDYNVVENPLLMRVRYDEIDGVLIPTYREYTQSNWDGDILKDEWTQEISENIKFTTGLRKDQFITSL